jgi:hypothetical protein
MEEMYRDGERKCFAVAVNSRLIDIKIVQTGKFCMKKAADF